MGTKEVNLVLVVGTEEVNPVLVVGTEEVNPAESTSTTMIGILTSRPAKPGILKPPQNMKNTDKINGYFILVNASLAR